MDFKQYIQKNKPESLPLEIEGRGQVSGVYFRRLNAGEGLQLKDSLAELIAASGDKLKEVATDGDVAKAEETVKSSLNSDQMRAMFRHQALFTFLHLSDKEGQRVYDDRKAFDEEVPEEFVQAFYAAGSQAKEQSEPDEAQAEKNSSTPTG